MNCAAITGPQDHARASDWKPQEKHLAFKKADFDKIPSHVFGVYGLWYRKRCIYVGKAEQQPIAQRLEQHWKGSHNDHLADWVTAKGSQLRVRYIPVEELSEIDSIEKRYIKNLQPLTNKNQK